MRTTSPEFGLGAAEGSTSGRSRGGRACDVGHKARKRPPRARKRPGGPASAPVAGANFPETGVPAYLARFLLTAQAVQSTYTSPAVQPSPEIRQSNVIALPLILLLGCDPDLTARCRSIATRAKVLARSAPVPFVRSEVTALSPLVIIVPADVYEGAPWGFEVLAEKVGASLLMLEREPIASIVLEYRIMDALVFATRLRTRLREAKLSMEARR